MNDDAIKQLVQSQFGAAAQSYITAPHFAHGDDLARMLELAQLRGDERVLDIATGGGHTALAFARRASEVVATDLTPEMLDAAAVFAREQGATNISFELADAEALPFADQDFDIVTVRIAPHHFPNPEQFVREAARVLRPDGVLLLNDNMAPEDLELDAFMNRVEQWRDPGHVRAYRMSEWRAWLEQAGFVIESVDPLQLKHIDFAIWTERMRMPPAERAALEAWILAAPDRCIDFFRIVIEDSRVRTVGTAYGIITARRG
jgi:ubiquinone/menaquinone biosynthesis C-methylase UbiE